MDEQTTQDVTGRRSRSMRLLFAVLTVVITAAAAFLLVTSGRDEPRSTSGVEERVRRALTEPGPERIAPDGETVNSVVCTTAERGWQCRVGFPSGLELDCFMGEGVAPGPYCRG